jgi:hypothetical protein
LNSPEGNFTQIRIHFVSQAPVVYDCTPRYLGGRDQEDHSSKSAWANSS